MFHYNIWMFMRKPIFLSYETHKNSICFVILLFCFHGAEHLTGPWVMLDGRYARVTPSTLTLALIWLGFGGRVLLRLVSVVCVAQAG